MILRVAALFVAPILATWLALAGAAARAEAPAFVGSAACADCHAEATGAWQVSDHAHAWALPSPETVLGDFGDVSFTHGGYTARFFRDGASYMIETEGPDGTRRPYKVVGVAGIKPLQQYLLSPEPGRTQVFDIAWDVEKRQWYPVFPDQAVGPGDGFHWTGPYKSWEARCAECHATSYSRHYDPKTHGYAPQMTEISVGCESCHGPGAAHLDWAKDPEAFTAAPGLTPHGLTVALEGRQAGEIAVCLTCHSRRESLADGTPLPGTAYAQTYSISLLRPGVYHADGQILDEVFEGGSFLQSKMFAKGVTCSNCHDPHSGALKAEGNAVCLQCHSPAGNPDFPSLPLKVFDGPEHTFHPQGSEGAKCVNCHMAGRNYMGIDFRRDHSFRIPRPDLDAATGAPDACTGCHTDKTPDWAAAEIATRFPDSAHRGPHYGTTLAAARTDAGGQTPALIALAEWQGPGIVRATALEMIPPLPAGPELERLAKLVADPDPLVRAALPGVFQGLPPDQRLAVIRPLLTDPVATVRAAAGKALLDLLTPDPDVAAALEVWQGGLRNRLDMPETHLQIGGAALQRRNLALAAQAFAEAVRQDPQIPAAWSMLVQIHAAAGDIEGARSLLAEGIRLNPGDPELFGLQAQMGGGTEDLLPDLP